MFNNPDTSHHRVIPALFAQDCELDTAVYMVYFVVVLVLLVAVWVCCCICACGCCCKEHPNLFKCRECSSEDAGQQIQNNQIGSCQSFCVVITVCGSIAIGMMIYIGTIRSPGASNRGQGMSGDCAGKGHRGDCQCPTVRTITHLAYSYNRFSFALSLPPSLVLNMLTYGVVLVCYNCRMAYSLHQSMPTSVFTRVHAVLLVRWDI